MLKIRVTGLEDTQKFVTKLESALRTRLALEFKNYISRHLVARIKSRLAHGTDAHTSAVGQKGLIGQAGGYGLPSNKEDYAEWKKRMTNLPITGSLSTRELVATGYLVENITVTKSLMGLETFLFEVGPRNMRRPKIYPMKKAAGSEDQAYLKKGESNIRIAQFLEEGKYKFWAKEFEDVRKELEPFLELVIVDVIKQLAVEFSGRTPDVLR